MKGVKKREYRNDDDNNNNSNKRNIQRDVDRKTEWTLFSFLIQHSMYAKYEKRAFHSSFLLLFTYSFVSSLKSLARWRSSWYAFSVFVCIYVRSFSSPWPPPPPRSTSSFVCLFISHTPFPCLPVARPLFRLISFDSLRKLMFIDKQYFISFFAFFSRSLLIYCCCWCNVLGWEWARGICLLLLDCCWDRVKSQLTKSDGIFDFLLSLSHTQTHAHSHKSSNFHTFHACTSLVCAIFH